MQSSYNLHSVDNFTVGILEYCSKSDLNEKECFYIEKYNCTNDLFGFNFRCGGQGGHDSYEFKENARKSKKDKSKAVFAFSKNGAFIKSGDSISLCADELRVSPCDIKRTIAQIQITCRGYILNNENAFRTRGYKLNFNLKSIRSNKKIVLQAKHTAKDFIDGAEYLNL